MDKYNEHLQFRYKLRLVMFTADLTAILTAAGCFYIGWLRFTGG